MPDEPVIKSVEDYEAMPTQDLLGAFQQAETDTADWNEQNPDPQR